MLQFKFQSKATELSNSSLLRFTSHSKGGGWIARLAAYAILCLGFAPVSVWAGAMDSGGQFDVAPSGAATYAIPIVVPPGIAGMEPRLALTYNSQGGNGLLGVGWSLSGLSGITRCPRTIPQDDVRGGVNYDTNDRFCLDGQRLLVISGSNGGNSSEYRTERESFSKVVSYGVSGSGPSWFKVWTKAGQIIEYGNTADSRILAQGGGDVRVWAINKIGDAKGNYLTFSYSDDIANGDYVPDRIDYTYGGGGANSGNSVRFIYETRPDISPLYLAGKIIKTTQRLVGVATYAGSTPVRRYQIAYDTSSSSGRSRIVSVTECELVTNTCKPENSFSWTGSSNASFQKISTFPTNYTFIADINGDGKGDLLFQRPYGFDVSLSTEDGFAAAVPWAGDFGSDYSWSKESMSWQLFPADVNGDGLADIVGFNTAGVYAALSNGSSFGAVQLLVSDLATGKTMDTYPRTLVDVNGDGLPDIVFFKTDGVYVALQKSEAFGFGPLAKVSQGFSYASNAVNPRSVADINGDGLPDLIAFTNSGMSVALNTGAGGNSVSFAAEQMKSSDFNMYGITDQNTKPRLLADVNGDGLLDIVVFRTDGVYVSLNMGTEFLAFAKWSSDFGAAMNPNQQGYPRYLVDVNGDGKADIVGFSSYASMYVALSTGTGFGSAVKWRENVTGFPASGSDWQLGDVDGDGFLDAIGQSSSYSGMTIADISGRAVAADLITVINNGLTAPLVVTYAPLTSGSVYTRGVGAVYPQIDIQAPFYVVSAVNIPNGLGNGTAVQNYQYGDLRVDVHGRGLLGFGWMQVTQADTGLSTHTDFRQDWPYTGLPSQTFTMLPGQGDDGHLKRIENIYGCLNPASGAACSMVNGSRYFPYVSQSDEKSWDANGVPLPLVRTSNTFDANGNATQVIVQTSDGFKKTTTNTYNDDTGAWYLGRLVSAQVKSQTNVSDSSIPSSSGAATFAFSDQVSANSSNYNLRSKAISQGWNPATPLAATVTIASGVQLSSSSAATSAFDTGLLPTGSVVTLINKGYIVGAGGTGGRGGDSDSNYLGLPGGAGGAGGNAIFTTAPIVINNEGYIYGGGGGGQGGDSFPDDAPAAGGGGGQGVVGGTGGQPGTQEEWSGATVGDGGSFASPGSGGTAYNGANGNSGGAWGQAGSGINGGAAGKAVIANGNSVSWLNGSGATQVKGTIENEGAGSSLPSVSPNSGLTSGGTVITLTGASFVTGTSVTVGGSPAVGCFVASATVMTCTTPAGTLGSKDVVITRPSASATILTGAFTYYDTNNFVFDRTIKVSTYNYNLREEAIAAGWDQQSALHATITVNKLDGLNQNVVIGSSSVSGYAFDTGDGFPANSTLKLINNGYIVGAGGSSEQNGGSALRAQYAIAVTNNGTIAGGGGGGGSGYDQYYSMEYTPGGDGAGDTHGAGANLLYGASGNWSSGYAFSGGGGGLGQAGQDGDDGWGTWIIPGGAAGAYAVGNSNISWVPLGDVRGNVQNFAPVTLGIARLSADREEGNSGSTPFTFTVTRSGDTSAATSVNWVVAGIGDYPANAADFVGGSLPSGTVGFAAGQTTQTVTVSVQGDTASEPDEQFVVTLSNPSAGATLTNATADGVIRNDDGGGFTLAKTIPDGTLNYNLKQDALAAGWNGTSALYATITVASGSVIGSANTSGYAFDTGEGFPTGTTLKLINNGYVVGAGGASDEKGGPALRAQYAISVTNNGTVAGGGGGGGSGYDQYYSMETVPGGSGAGYTHGEGAALTYGSGGNWSSGYAYSGNGGALGQPGEPGDDGYGSWPAPGGAAGEYVVGNSNVSWDPAGTGQQRGATQVSIPASLGISALSADGAEGNSGSTPFTFIITRSGGTSGAVSVSWTVTGSGNQPASATDFVGGVFPSGTVSFADGQTTQIITINVQGDTTSEQDEGFTVTLSNVSAGTTLVGATAVGVIRNDDGEIFIFTKTLLGNILNYNLKQDALASGWNGTAALSATITVASGTIIGSANTSGYAFDTGSGLPAGSTVALIINIRGAIVGAGGAGGDNGNPGQNGGPALRAQVPMTITNNGMIGGGGGGGGSGYDPYYTMETSPGGSGAGYLTGEDASAGNGGYENWSESYYAVSGQGGSLGQPGGDGGDAYGAGTVVPGGQGGACVTGSSNIIWSVAGARYGALN